MNDDERDVWRAMGLTPFPGIDDLRAQGLKVLEEAAELAEACKRLDDMPIYEMREMVLDEFADVLQALTNLAACCNVSEHELQSAAVRCHHRNVERGRYETVPEQKRCEQCTKWHRGESGGNSFCTKFRHLAGPDGTCAWPDDIVPRC